MAPELSFVVPAYDCADVLGEAVESALAQELDVPFEVVIVDDASTDDTAAVIDRLRAASPLVRAERHEVNRGGGAARNTAIGLAAGSLLYMLDSDNVLPAGVVQQQLDRLRLGDVEAVSVGSVRFFRDQDGARKVTHSWALAGSDGVSRLHDVFTASEVPAAHGNYLYSRALYDAAGGYEEDRGAMDAWTFGFKHLARGFDVGLVPGAWYLHRNQREGRPSYWSRDERLGRNDANAVRTIQERAGSLPTDLAEKMALLRPGDPFFMLVAEGAFALPAAQFRGRLRRARRRATGRQLLARLRR
jgi:glycosyltransferase involved in cell wall biosynthesis